MEQSYKFSESTVGCHLGAFVTDQYLIGVQSLVFIRKLLHAQTVKPQPFGQIFYRRIRIVSGLNLLHHPLSLTVYALILHALKTLVLE
jgi:hypothetical protein